MGDELAAAKTPNESIYISLNALCQALGVSGKAQTERIQRTPTLAKGLRRIPLKTAGGTQRVNCLRIDRVALWIAGLETNRIKPQYREKIEAFQDDLADVAMKVFLRAMGIQTTATAPATSDPAIIALVEQYETLSAVVLDLRDHLAHMSEGSDAMRLQMADAVKLLESLANHQNQTNQTIAHLQQKTAGLTPAQQEQIRRAINIIAKESNGTVPQSRLYAALYRRFAVASYKQIPEEQFEDAAAMLKAIRQQIKDGIIPEQGEMF